MARIAYRIKSRAADFALRLGISRGARRAYLHCVAGVRLVTS